MDEIDAVLDDRNVRRFAEILREFSKKTQFMVVAHNRATTEVADVLYGVTFDGRGVKDVAFKTGILSFIDFWYNKEDYNEYI